MTKSLMMFVFFIVPIFLIQSASTEEPAEKAFQEPKTYEEAHRLTHQTAGFKNLQKIGLALHNYHDLFGQFPSAVLYAPDGKTLHSWRVELLPLLRELRKDAEPVRLRYMDRELYHTAIKDCGYDINEPWDSPVNREVLKSMPSVYRHPSDKPDSTESAWYAVVGKGTVFDPGEVAQYKDIKGWPASTLMLAESRSRAPWTKPVDIAYSKDATVPRLGGFTDHGFLVLTGDGGVHFISDSISPKDLRAFISKDPADTFDIVGVPYRY
ncbi:DUF1559 family PulG-like putative transporter [Gimesia fumaroli]|uniref:DUF1559 domain-containing protein n=1 Tax=Gimesia fumaroli TaxID=2527976 RepID=A0A518I6M4_9PLAN|nr:DUF1559 domain-containing protein [Gimesia fumaroli]QDV48720.1 hypothetical protein Enr17x_07330 [Gimesia fumaroli]